MNVPIEEWQPPISPSPEGGGVGEGVAPAVPGYDIPKFTPPPAAPAVEPKDGNARAAQFLRDNAQNFIDSTVDVVASIRRAATPSPAPTVESAEHPLSVEWRNNELSPDRRKIGDRMAAELTRQFHELQQQAREIERLTGDAREADYLRNEMIGRQKETDLLREAAEARCGELGKEIDDLTGRLSRMCGDA